MSSSDYQFESNNNTSSNRRLSQVNNQIRDLMQEIFLKEFGSSLGLISIIYVKTSPDLRNARIYISAFPAINRQYDPEEVINILKQKTPKLRHLLAQKLKIKYIPKLSFSLDQTLANAQRVEELLNQVKQIKQNND